MWPMIDAPVHPITACYPLMAEDEMAELCADIAANGMQQPVVMQGDMVLDGRNRIMACERTGTPIRTIQYTGDDPVAYIIGTNRRRNLTASQRAMVAAKIATLELGSNQHKRIRQLADPTEKANGVSATMARGYEQRGPSAATTQSQAAAALDVSKRQIRRAKALERKLPELAGQVASGAMTLHAALKQAERQNGEGRPIGLPSNNEDTQRDEHEFNHQRIIEANRQGAFIIVPPQHQVRAENLHVSDDSYEWYTPSKYIRAARRVMGSIDTDPASCETANKVVRAQTFYTSEDNGLDHVWPGNVWLNPPYNMPWIREFIRKAISEFAADHNRSLMILTNNSTDTGWFHLLINSAPVCLTRGRIRFWGPDGGLLATRQGQAIFYLGQRIDSFTDEFTRFGAVVSK